MRLQVTGAGRLGSVGADDVPIRDEVLVEVVELMSAPQI